MKDADEADTCPFQQDFLSRKFPPDISASDAFGIYALGVYIQEPDLDALAADALTAGNDDKKADFVFLDRELGRAFVGQSYLSKDWARKSAKSNKASDLNVAIGWLLSADAKDLPDALKSKSTDLIAGLNDGSIRKLYLLYTHNCKESENVKAELKIAARTAKKLVGKNVKVFGKELGVESISKLYDKVDKNILVTEEKTVEVGSEMFRLHGPKWKAVATVVSGEVLHEWYSQHGEQLFSANIRNYLGSLTRKRGNINSEIKATVETSPDNFWAFNNGVTILTNSFTISGGTIRLRGVSVINGAQTTGVIGECNLEDARKARVPCRFIMCSDADTIDEIISFNNTQNAIKSFDLRSNDRVQKRLSQEFSEAQIIYVHRRSNLRRPPIDSIHVETVAQGLASFHDRFQNAIRQRSSIFEDDEVYDAVFPMSSDVRHVYLIQCLLDAVDSLKLQYRREQSENNITDLRQSYLDFLGYSTAKQFVINVVGRVAPQIAGEKIDNLHLWFVKREVLKPDRAAVVKAWLAVLNIVMPRICRATKVNTQSDVRSTERAHEVAEEVSEYLESMADEVAVKFGVLRKMTKIDS